MCLVLLVYQSKTDRRLQAMNISEVSTLGSIDQALHHDRAGLADKA